MKKTAITTGLVLGVLATHSLAFDMGSMLKSAAPAVAQSVAPQSSSALQNNVLISSLGSSLGVNPTQAIGGSAVLLNSAKSKMDPAQFSTLTQKTPGLGDILSSGAASSLLGNTTPQSQFNALGMDASLIGKFTPIIVEYAKGFVSPEIATALSLALSM